MSRFLALRNARQRPGALAGALMPVIVLVGIATGTLLAASVDAANGMLGADGAGDRGTELLNYLVVGMISLFAAIMVVNSLAAAVADRGRELALQRLAGSTRRQVERMVVYEALLIATVGIAVGLLGSLATAVPYMAVKHTWILGTGAWLFAAVAAVALAVTVGAALLAVRRVAAEAPTRRVARHMTRGAACDRSRWQPSADNAQLGRRNRTPSKWTTRGGGRSGRNCW